MGDTQHVEPASPLPRPRTSFIGREREVAEAGCLLASDDVALLTLTGPGGVGKTRLALQAAASAAGAFPDGVAFASLASVADPRLVLREIAQALGIQDAGNQPIAGALVGWLRGRAMLLVLDNLEHVIEVAPEIAGLLDACPRLTILAASRVPLRVSAEHEFQVASLTLPERVDSASLDVANRSSAIELFVERARAVMPGFALTEQNAASVTEICRRLDGLPLAIELAAARCKVLSPQSLAERLTERLTLLTGGPRDLPARQQTMRGAIAWSYDLLSPSEQRLLAQLAVFRGGWTLEAAEAVVDAEHDIVEGLSVLADHSLVQLAEQPDGASRLGMLETIREFGLERLAAAEPHGATRDRHAAHFLAFAEEAETRLAGPEARVWLDRLEQEHDNLRAALTWFYGRQDAERGLRLAGSLREFWWLRGYLAEGASLARAFLDLPGSATDTPGRVKALTAAGQLARWRDDYQVAEQLSEEALARAQRVGDQRAVPFLLLNLGLLAQLRGDIDSARGYWERCLEMTRDLGDTPNLVQALNHLGVRARLDGDASLAATRFEEGLALARAAGLQLERGLSLLQLGILAEQKGEPGRAAALYQESLADFRDLRARWGVARLVERLASIARVDGQWGRAARLYAAASALRERIGWSLPEVAGRRSDHDRAVADVRATLGAEAFEAAWAEGWAKPVDEIIAEALAVSVAAPAAAEAVAGLTPREVDVLRLIVEGRSNQEIATELFVSQHTVASHVAHILSKLGLDSRTAAATWAIRHEIS